jgi:hypothetical protein
MFVEPAWITTVVHLEQLNAIVAKTSSLGRMFNLFALPPGLPSIDISCSILGSVRLPAVMLASGLMETQPAQIVGA